MTSTKCKEKSGQGRFGESLQAHPDRHTEAVTKSSVQTRSTRASAAGARGWAERPTRLGSAEPLPPPPSKAFSPSLLVDQALSPSRADHGAHCLLPVFARCSQPPPIHRACVASLSSTGGPGGAGPCGGPCVPRLGQNDVMCM